VHPLVERLGWATCAVAAVVLLLGTVVTGSGPHSGDADEPARFGFDPRTISWLHADAVMLFLGLVVAVWVASRVTTEATLPGRAWAAVLVVTLAQGVVGYTQYLTGLPWVVVLVHMLLATLLVVALTRAMVRLRSTP
jgi:cytochrome c oxidase assembly protein subunit 15